MWGVRGGGRQPPSLILRFFLLFVHLCYYIYRLFIIGEVDPL